MPLLVQKPRRKPPAGPENTLPKMQKTQKFNALRCNRFAALAIGFAGCVRQPAGLADKPLCVTHSP
jgi:hypothetical protein